MAVGIASIFLKTETELLLKSRNVYPEKLIETDFNFHIPLFDEAVLQLIKYS
jgi:NAD dependent epimerase/dehydratase family enzyme